MRHGTFYSYRKCRCPECVAFMSAYRADWKRRNPGKTYQKNDAVWQAARRGWWWRWVRLLKAEQGCCLCGRKDGRLDHHHVDPSTKTYGVSQMANCSVEAIVDEIAKCVVLCVGCHCRWHSDMRREAL